MAKFNPYDLQENYQENALKFSLFTLLVSLLILGVYFSIFYPGILNEDHFHSLLSKSSGQLFAIQSNLYSLICFLLIDLFDSSAGIGFLHILLSSTTLAYIVYNLVKFKIRRSLVILTIIPFVFLPSVFLYTFSYHRDIIFSWLIILLVSLIFFGEMKKKYFNQKPQLFKITLFLFISCLIAALRIDGIVFSFGTLLLFFSKFKKEKSMLVKLGLIFIVFNIFFKTVVFLPFESIYKHYPVHKSYYLTTVLNPMAYILKNRKGQLSLVDREVVEEVILLEDLTRYENDLNIPMVHNQKVKSELTSTQVNSFLKVFAKIAVKNLDLFIMNRFKLFYNTLGVGRHSMYLLDDQVGIAGGETIKDHFNIRSVKKKNFLRLATFTNYRDSSRILLWSSLWSLLLILAGLFSRRTRVIRFFCLLFALRTAIVFLLEPATHFIYLFSNYLVGFLLVSFTLVELSNRNEMDS